MKLLNKIVLCFTAFASLQVQAEELPLYKRELYLQLQAQQNIIEALSNQQCTPLPVLEELIDDKRLLKIENQKLKEMLADYQGGG